MTNLRQEIETVINKNSAESMSNTPDFILAEYLVDCLAAFDKATNRRTEWYKTDNAKPTNIPIVADKKSKKRKTEVPIGEVNMVPSPEDQKAEAESFIKTVNKLAEEASKAIPTPPVVPKEVTNLKIDTTDSVANPLYAKVSKGWSDPFKGTSWGNKK